ncbi:MAG TPA: SUMF1/EgtB/PvdO family nonheme iron enzyme [Saprospiraceae bacterium]|nr:SUMF1/EgtB/PvdO family nonheme iron enzyme [Saprospiraceae bacterium]
MKNLFSLLSIFAVFTFVMSSCGGGKGDESSSTGWEYNNPEWGGFEKVDYEGQVTGPNLVLIEGGTFTMGLVEQDVTYEWNAIPRRVTVSSFYMDETEVSNINWKEYVHWLRKTYISYPEVYRKALPDTLVGGEGWAYNEPYVETYYRHPAYDDYPVVGVSWLQCKDFASWRSDRVNEMLLIKRGILNPSPDQKDSESFDTKAYLDGQYSGNVKKNLPDLTNGGERPVRFEDGILLPDYILPTEAQWEYAALALVGNQAASKDELITDRRYYPWNGNTARYKKHDGNQGDIMANFKRGRGDYMGMAGNLNDNASITAPVKSFLPNDFGLYNMAGNVSEWCNDVYRPLTGQTEQDAENQDLNGYRGNHFEKLVMDEDGTPAEKDSLGRLKYEFVTDEESADRENYHKGNVKNYLDGDAEYIKYGYGVTSLVSDKARVVKGGSWADRLYWLSPGTRRFKDEDKSDRTIGFRCAMVRVGGESGNEDTGGNNFGKQKEVKRRF